jgi:hypothetical protein
MRPRTRSLALQPLAYSKPDAAVVAGVGLSKIKEAVKDGELAEVEKDGRRLILHEDLREWLLRDRVIRANGHPADEEPNGTPRPAAPEAPTHPPMPPGRRGRPAKSARAPPHRG